MEKSNCIAAMTALAHDTRLDVFRLLVRQAPAGLPAGAIAEGLGLPAATLSFHLTTLRHANLVHKRRQGRQVFYSARYRAMSELMAFLLENCCQGNPQACAFLNQVSPASSYRQAGD